MDQLFLIVSCCTVLFGLFDVQATRSIKLLNNGFVVREYLPQYGTRVNLLVQENVECRDVLGNPVTKDLVAVSTNDGWIAYCLTTQFMVVGYNMSIYQERFFEAIATVLYDFSEEYGYVPENSNKKLVHGTPQDFAYLIKVMLTDNKNRYNFHIAEFNRFFPDIKLPDDNITYSQPIPDGTLLIATPDDAFCNMQQYLWLKNNQN